ncbi:tryptophan-rich sensory protein [Candidatus Kaiserbacteria bacterium]|nr:tryptophan-rich sensory protein [Candidatus Kaiserbacteria bacterium]
MTKKNIFGLVVAVLGSEMAGIVGAFFTTLSIPTWYATLIKPEWNPPAWLFGPVWTILFAMMGAAAFLIWKQGLERPDVRRALMLFIVQLAINTLWSAFFFGARNIGGALVEIGFLWLAIVATIIVFGRISRAAAWLLVPYLLWVSFAAYLNYTIWILN